MYNDKHKLFLQYMLKNGIQTLEKAIKFCQAIEAANVTNAKTLQKFTQDINNEISKQKFQIHQTTCEVTGNEVVILINTANDEISKLQIAFSQTELEFFQQLMHEVITSDEKKLKHILCINLTSKMTKKLTHTDAEKLIAKWIKMGYLVMLNDYIHLGARCIVEFTPFFQSHCGDYITSCNLCSELVFVGRTCDSCETTMHAHCLEKYLTKKKLCPSCKEQWCDSNNDNDNSLENASSDDDDS